jgi:hypothetical protein
VNFKVTPTNQAGRDAGRVLRATWGAAVNNGAPITAYHFVVKDLATAATGTRDVPTTGPSSFWCATNSPNCTVFSGLTNGRKYEVSISAVNAAGPGPVSKATATAGIETILTLVRSRSVATWGTPVDLSGQLTSRAVNGVVRPLASKTIVLTFAPAKGSPIQRTAKTTSTGAWVYKGLKFSYNWTVKAQYLGDVSYRPALRTSSVLVASRVLRSYPANGSSSSSSTTLKIVGSVAPNAFGQTVTLQRYLSGKWVNTTAKATLGSNSTFVLSLKPSRGKYIYRVFMPAQYDLFKRQINAAGTSSGFTLYRT